MTSTIPYGNLNRMELQLPQYFCPEVQASLKIASVDSNVMHVWMHQYFRFKFRGTFPMFHHNVQIWGVVCYWVMDISLLLPVSLTCWINVPGRLAACNEQSAGRIDDTLISTWTSIQNEQPQIVDDIVHMCTCMTFRSFAFTQYYEHWYFQGCGVAGIDGGGACIMFSGPISGQISLIRHYVWISAPSVHLR